MAAETHFRNFHARGREWNEEEWLDLLALGDSGRLGDQVRQGTVVASVWDVLDDDDAMGALVDAAPDVIVGGPPCQGFSMAGRRNPEDERNQLPWAYLRFVRELRPKAVVIENVVGINRAFRSKGGVVPAFEQLRRALEVEGDGYVVQPVEVNARHFGVPQNRPRMMLIALRSDLPQASAIEVSSDPWRSADVWAQMLRGQPVPTLSLVPVVGSRVKDDDPLTEHSAWEAMCDLDETDYAIDADSDLYRDARYRYAAQMRCVTGGAPVDKPRNHLTRNHTFAARQRFDLYHYMAENGIESSVLSIPKRPGSDVDKRRAVAESLGDFGSALPEGRIFVDDADTSLVDTVFRLATKKHTQRVIAADVPAPTVVTLPDDYVHPRNPRIMTVRELARIQSFPDWFEFRSKETTGSHRRKVEVPQYSQVGNAVPPLLGQAVGEVVRSNL
jgi:DNA (cytosine-5)-methyltransferase 1